MFNERYKDIIWWSVIFAGLFAILQITSRYTFFYIEQTQMFMFCWSYIREKLLQPGGLTLLAGEFLGQFYVLNYAGAIISAAAITSAGVTTSYIIRLISPASNLIILPLLVIISLLCITLDFNYGLQDTLSLVLTLCCLSGHLKLRASRKRVVYATVSVIVLFLLAGSVHPLFAICVIIWEVLNREKGWYLAFIPVFLSVIISYLGMRYALYGEPRFAFLPIGYFSQSVAPVNNIYLTTIPFAVIAAYLLRNIRPMQPKVEIAAKVAQLLIIVFLGWKGVDKYRINEFYDVMELDHYAHTEQWDKIVERAPALSLNRLNLCNLNMALAHKGELMDKMFAFEQLDSEGLIVTWDMTKHIATLLSDIAFTIGQISTAQEMAFESSVINSFSNARMLKRLVQTNLIYGDYTIAKRYLDRLEKSLFYREWAKEHRRFLHDNEAVIADPLLGGKRADLLPEDENYISTSVSYEGLQKMVMNNPSNRVPLEYFIALSLLSDNLAVYKYILETNFGSEALKTLPRYCQEAALIVYGADPEIIEHYGISEQVVADFNRFDTSIRLVRSRSAPAVLKSEFGNTFWYYNVTSDKR